MLRRFWPAIASRRPDVILLDLLMPRLDGFGVIERLQQDPRLREIPVIVLTSKVLNDEERTRLETRAVGLIDKSGLERDALIKEIRDALQAYRRSQPEG